MKRMKQLKRGPLFGYSTHKGGHDLIERIGRRWIDSFFLRKTVSFEKRGFELVVKVQTVLNVGASKSSLQTRANIALWAVWAQTLKAQTTLPHRKRVLINDSLPQKDENIDTHCPLCIQTCTVCSPSNMITD